MKVQTHYSPDIYAAWKVGPQFQWRSFVQFVFWVIPLLLAIRFLLKLFMPYSAGDFGNVLYSITEYLLLPLSVVFRVSPSSTGPVFEWLTLLTILGYWLLVVGIQTLLREALGVSQIEIAREYSKRKYGHGH